MLIKKIYNKYDIQTKFNTFEKEIYSELNQQINKIKFKPLHILNKLLDKINKLINMSACNITN